MKKKANNVYTGEMGPDGWPGIVTVNGESLPPRTDLWNHSPTGFAWGYGGSGPAQLALAILAHHLGDDNLAVFYHQMFKWQVIARLPGEQGWTLTSADITRSVWALEEPAPQVARNSG